MSSLNNQVGGTHYTDLQYQPIQLSFDINGTPTFCKVAKYTSRVKDNMCEQIEKAIHCVKLEAELWRPDVNRYYPVSKMHMYLTLNCVQAFTDQLKHGALIKVALMAMVHHEYQKAIEALQTLRSHYE